MKLRIELATNLVVIGLATLLIALFVKSGMGPGTRVGASVGVRAGDVVPAVPNLRLAPTGSTLILAIRAGCHFCEASMPFYARLVSLQRAEKLNAALLAVLPDDTPTANLLLAAHPVQLPFVAGVPLSELNVRGTPTLILARADHRVLRVWVGQLPSREQQDLIAVLSAEPKS